MKKFYIFFAGLFLLAIQLKAQAPASLNFQGVVRNTSGLVLQNQPVGLRFSIHQTTPTGTIVYRETQSATSNSLGLFTVAVGTGTVVSGTFATIGWASNAEFLQVEMDPNGGTSYNDMGTNQYLSVPYALSAGTSAAEWKLTGNSAIGSGYLGTSDPNDFAVRANNSQLMKLGNAGTNVGIGPGSPNAAAELDINSTTMGFLMPRLAVNPTTNVQGMMYYNTTTGCIMYYSGTAWNAMVCPCPNTPPTPGAITSSNGAGNTCASKTGLIYSIAPISNAISYTWTVPASPWLLTAGAGTNVITVTSGTASGTMTVSATNNCGTSATSSLTLTVGTGPCTISTQPASVGATPTTSATFTVGVTGGGGQAFQWYVSTTGVGGTYTAVTNGGVYSGATTPNLVITNPPVTMNTYYYEVKMTPVCGTATVVTSNPAELFVCTTTQPSIVITLTNTVAATTTAANLPVMITVNSSLYGAYENVGLNNIEFTSGNSVANGGTPLYAWLESGNLNSSASTVWWVNLGSLTITNGTPQKIYMNFLPTNQMTGPTAFTGEAPQLSGLTTPSYGSLDNGAKVFPFYDNFAGTTLNAGNWLSNSVSGAFFTVNNGITFQTSESSSTTWNYSCITSLSTFAPNAVGEVLSYNCPPAQGGNRSLMPAFVGQNAVAQSPYLDDIYTGTVNGSANTPTSFVSYGNGRNGSAAYYFCQSNTTTSATTNTSVTSPLYVPTVETIYYTGTTNSFYQNYVSKATAATNSPTGSLYFAMGVNNSNGINTGFSVYWARTRIAPPFSGTTPTPPTVAFGPIGCN